MFHLAAYFVAVGQVANLDMTAQTDQILPIDSANHFLPNDQLNMIGAYASALTINRARLDSPRYRQIAQPYIEPVNLALLPAHNPNYMDRYDNPLRVPALSPLAAQMTSALACGTEASFVGLWLESQRRPAPVGDIYTLRATGATTVTAKAWSDVALTFDQSIVEGTYAVIGGCAYATTAVFWRLIFDNQFYRPGGIGFATRGLRGPPRQYGGGWGLWGTFKNTSMPRLQIYCNAADTAQTLFLECIKVA